jgi:hypothetical protein
MGCHAQVWNVGPLLAPVRASFIEGKPLRWRRVHQVPGFVYFNHAIHVNKGVGCVTCHGRVDRMPAVEQVAPLTMGWCLECHRNPAPRLRPVAEMTTMASPPAREAAQVGRQVMEELGVHTRTSCTTCHR